MKILYAVQRTGNGHLARAQEIIPILKKYAEVDVLASGSQAQIDLDCEIKYSFLGISLFYNKKGGLSFFKMLVNNRFIPFFKQVLSLPVQEYDLIINDFEPISAWACKLRKGNIIALSHQAALWFPQCPKPSKTNTWAMRFFKYYAPIKQKYGFHFNAYNAQIFTPVIRAKVRNLSPYITEKYLVYLPSFSDEKLYEELSKIGTIWHIFSKHTSKKYQKGNCNFYPIDEHNFLADLESCKGVLCSAGFELPSEALFLKKKLFVIPIKKQFEQAYNAKALASLGVPTSKKLVRMKLKEWVTSNKVIEVNYPDKTEEIIVDILNNYAFGEILNAKKSTISQMITID